MRAGGVGGLPVLGQRDAGLHSHAVVVLVVGLPVVRSDVGERARAAGAGNLPLALLAEPAGTAGAATPWSRPPRRGRRCSMRCDARRARAAPARLRGAADASVDRGVFAFRLGRARAGGRAPLGTRRGVPAGVPGLCHSAQHPGHGRILPAARGGRRGLCGRARRRPRSLAQRNPTAVVAGRLPVRRGRGLLRCALPHGAGGAVAPGGLPQFPPLVGAGVAARVVFAVYLCRQRGAHLRNHRGRRVAGTEGGDDRARVVRFSGVRHRAGPAAGHCGGVEARSARAE